MKDVNFHEIIISKSDQKIISADARIYEVFGNYITKPMNELIAIEDMDIYMNNIKNCDGNWYPSKIICPDIMYYTYISAERYNDKLIRLTVVNAHNLLNAHSTLMKTINSINAQLGLYDDVFFEYNLNDESITVFNTESTDFDNANYSLSEFEDILLQRTDDEQKQAVRSFISQVKVGVGRSTTIIKGNILNDDESVTSTVLDEGFFFYDKDTEGVVGHIQLKRIGEAIKPSTIKHDSLTGLIDKTDIIRMARERIDDKRIKGTALAIIDVDFFKNINDSYGHQFGDDVIKKVADIISNEVGTNGVSGRFGGDEFFIMLYNIETEGQLRYFLNGIKTKVSATFPDRGIDRDNPLSVSIGASVYPSDADNYDDLFLIADHCLYLAKEKGRNRYIIYTLQKHGSLEDIKANLQNTKKLTERDTSYGDFIVKMFDLALYDKGLTIERYMTEFADTFGLQSINLLVGRPFRHRCAAGSEAVNDQEAVDFVLSKINSDDKDKYFSLGDFVVINDLTTLPPYVRNIKEFLQTRHIYSLINIRFYDKDQRECILIISSIGRKTKWNHSRFKYYRAFTSLLSLYSLGEDE
ncbi:MAG: GGDEF domain-containing protein [Butyrivibrio sp.]|uniref:GGDEF domain-containing protein n=1 Tax=Butyrivibrio sp. TaxID=28121 RepID=UPI0025D26ABC|nr:GGDEF domain-containing protein [Butyrivibrio sp.]MCR5773307.1 GGDEF domain-containing protein [Butyrivibrio sp.]